ncbi:hypothetical protein H4O05_09350 [Citrobacter freundii]|uniref:Uncharacterized protein n=1 Tax=Citrobacter freundii TaxID=546 RepID=A0A385ELP7_CITFR|nr:hypothetical protein [Citrobacter freundii]AXQ86302.1 hypothetical protein [Citrobacter freundii]UNM04891.1 hypothetical protein H4O05_09350 [Citrobacter freundii]
MEKVILEQMQQEITNLQARIGSAEYLIKFLYQRLPKHEIEELDKEMSESLKSYGEDSIVGEILSEGLRLLRK